MFIRFTSVRFACVETIIIFNSLLIAVSFHGLYRSVAKWFIASVIISGSIQICGKTVYRFCYYFTVSTDLWQNCLSLLLLFQGLYRSVAKRFIASVIISGSLQICGKTVYRFCYYFTVSTDLWQNCSSLLLLFHGLFRSVAKLFIAFVIISRSLQICGKTVYRFCYYFTVFRNLWQICSSLLLLFHGLYRFEAKRFIASVFFFFTK